ncbi:hypothetical protein LCGC14_1411160 [marine sediment metagenome]|uniref:CR-type domain-containing protein n=1 Tax=marine sediment metagenome TaxID=412755 RepID=A0A0F9JUK7_9ZZZZ
MKEGDVVGSIRALEHTRTHEMTTPHKCPVCGGHGKLPDKWGGTGTYTPTATRQCHACKGTGMVWEPQPTPTVQGGLLCSKCGGTTHATINGMCSECYRGTGG